MNSEYKNWIVEVKQKVRSSQAKAALAVNTALIEFYWDLGAMLSEKLKQSDWGDKVLEQVSKDLRSEFPDMSGFSVSNLKTCKLFYNYFSISSQAVNQFFLEGSPNSSQSVNQLEADKLSNQKIVFQDITKIPWGHIKVIITKIKNIDEALFYIQQTITNNWSRDMHCKIYISR